MRRSGPAISPCSAASGPSSPRCGLLWKHATSRSRWSGLGGLLTVPEVGGHRRDPAGDARSVRVRCARATADLAAVADRPGGPRCSRPARQVTRQCPSTRCRRRRLRRRLCRWWCQRARPDRGRCQRPHQGHRQPGGSAGRPRQRRPRIPSPDTPGWRRLAAELRVLRGHVARPLAELVTEVERTLGLDIEVASRPGADPAAARADLDAFADAAAAFAGDAQEPTLGAFLAYLVAAESEEFGLEAGQVGGDRLGQACDRARRQGPAMGGGLRARARRGRPASCVPGEAEDHDPVDRERAAAAVQHCAATLLTCRRCRPWRPPSWPNLARHAALATWPRSAARLRRRDQGRLPAGLLGLLVV